jgi:hypothetical protein
MINAQPTPFSAAASTHGAATPSLALLEARRLRDALKLLLRREQAAMAEFLVALADFDRRRGWEPLGHASLFAFILAELGLSPAPTYWRQEAARLLQRFPDLVEPLRQGRLCLSTMAELAKVLTEENRAAILPRFLGISSRDAKELVAELQPRPSPPMRTVVTPLAPAARHTDPESLWAPKAPGAHLAHPARPARVESRRDDVDPLTAELSRLSTTVSRRFLQKLKTARAGLSHTIPGATTEQVLEAAVDLLLEKQARARGQVKRPRANLPTATPTLTPAPTLTEPPPHRRAGPRATIPAAVRRAVWQRDGGRCQWPLDGGGCCGSTHRLELDHIVPWADWGGETEANLRVTCAAHNRLAARQEFGERCVDRYAG